jgi:hypothetical protein
LLVFVLPAVLAIIGAAVAGEGEVRRFVGLSAGLAAGLLIGVVSALITRVARPAGSAPTSCKEHS